MVTFEPDNFLGTFDTNITEREILQRTYYTISKEKYYVTLCNEIDNFIKGFIYEVQNNGDL